MPKVCSKKTCTREAGPKFKTCQGCRDSRKKSKRKMKRAAAEAVPKEGHRHCTNCCHEWPLEQFDSVINRRAKLTAHCASCRALHSKTQKSETTKVGQCRKLWEEWRDSHACLHCGTTDCIEADHLDRSKKVHRCSAYTWWSWNGGVEALKKELAKVRPLCRFCHNVHSSVQRGISKDPTKAKKRRHVNAIKMRIGCCQTCQRKVTPETLCCFDFNHLDTETKRDNISIMVCRYKLKDFFEYIGPETELCRLECANCHWKYTRAQMKEMTAKVSALAQASPFI
jgi:hypothetical protein